MNAYRRCFFAVSLLLSCVVVAAGQQDKAARRLESVTWSPVTHKLSWTVQNGTITSAGDFKGADKVSYEIDMDDATMSTSAEGRRFSKKEAVNVHKLMDLVAKYAADSTLWWEAGQGEPLDGSSKPKPDSDSDGGVFERKHPRKERSQPSTVIRIKAEQ